MVIVCMAGGKTAPFAPYAEDGMAYGFGDDDEGQCTIPSDLLGVVEIGHIHATCPHPCPWVNQL